MSLEETKLPISKWFDNFVHQGNLLIDENLMKDFCNAEDVKTFYELMNTTIALCGRVGEWYFEKRDKKYFMIITSEDERYDPDLSHGGVQLDFFADKPWEGKFECFIEGDSYEELEKEIIKNDVEGLFYQLHDCYGNRISYGSVDFDAIEEEIEEYEGRE